jgi:hypothetical protein
VFEPIVASYNVVLDLYFVLAIEGRLSCHQEISYHTAGPDVSFFVIGTPFNDFWRHEMNGSAISAQIDLLIGLAKS